MPCDVSRVNKLLALDHQWDAWKGNTIEALAAAVALVEQRGFKIWSLLLNHNRFNLLKAKGAFPWDGLHHTTRFQGHPVLISDEMLDNTIYVIGDEWPASQKAVVVLVWERKTAGWLPCN